MSRVSEAVRRMVRRCAWCRAELVPEMDVVIVGARFASWSPPVEALRGHVVHVTVARVPHALAAVAPMAGTPAHAAGYDVLFVLCCGACRDGLGEALRGEVIQLTIPEPRGPREGGVS